MAVINHIDKFELSSTIKASYLRGANYLVYDVSILHGDNEYMEVVPRQRVNNWWELTNTRLTSPLAMNAEYMDEGKLDEETFEYDDTAFTVAAGFIFGDFTRAKVPIFKPDNYNHVMVDLIASSFASAIKNQFSRTYAYLRFAQVLISLARAKKRRDITESKPVHRSLRPFEL